MDKLRVLDLFSGIGGFSLGLERTGGFETVAFCEIEPFPRRVLAKHWPEVPCYEDVRTLTGARLAADGITGIDVITGGFPCQDLSVAGKQRGMGEGTRSGLWSEIVRLVGELRPSYVIVENVAALLSGPSEKRGGWFGRVLGDLAECGYDAEWENIPASALGAPHRRERVWLVGWATVGRDMANADQVGTIRAPDPRVSLVVDESGARVSERRTKSLADATKLQRDGGNHNSRIGVGAEPLSQLGNGRWAKHLAHSNGINEQGQQSGIINAQEWQGSVAGPSGPCSASIGRQWQTEPGMGRVVDGVPDRAHRLATLGNSVVPQIPELIGRAILAAQVAA
jgi:DNA (cytosine-5)-methyltransferase 1